VTGWQYRGNTSMATARIASADRVTNWMAEQKIYRKGSNTASRVAAEIRRAIRHGELLPGEHVRQEHWAERMGVSSGPTREALKILVTEQLLTYQAHHGYFVTRLNLDEMRQIYVIRRLLEAEMIRTMRWPTPEEIASLKAQMDGVLDHLTEGDLHGAQEAARQIHFVMYSFSSDDVIVRETKRYFDMATVDQGLLLGTIEDPHANNLSIHYDAVIACLEAGDREKLIEVNSQERARVSQQIFTYQ
jgi:DNA-binding GntR family transcriptional regulator